VAASPKAMSRAWGRGQWWCAPGEVGSRSMVVVHSEGDRVEVDGSGATLSTA
jgi:hypothetical protein